MAGSWVPMASLECKRERFIGLILLSNYEYILKNKNLFEQFNEYEIENVQYILGSNEVVIFSDRGKIKNQLFQNSLTDKLCDQDLTFILKKILEILENVHVNHGGCKICIMAPTNVIEENFENHFLIREVFNLLHMKNCIVINIGIDSCGKKRGRREGRLPFDFFNRKTEIEYDEEYFEYSGGNGLSL
jgi:hypothetical protein